MPAADYRAMKGDSIVLQQLDTLGRKGPDTTTVKR